MTLPVIPSFYLYGEPHRAVAPGFIHVEELDDRSRPSEWTIRPHAHADLVQLFLIDTGGGVMQVEDRTLHFAAPAVLTMPVAVVHGFAWTSDSTGTVLTIAKSFLEELAARHPELSPVLAQPRALAVDADTARIVRNAAASLRRELGWSAPGYPAAVEAALLSLLVTGLRLLPPDRDEIVAEPGPQAALVARFRAQVEHRFRLREGIAVYASALGTSETSLRAACARVAGLSPAAILDQRAILEAKRALLYSNLAVGQVGYAVGIADPAYFTRFFTRHAGISPRGFRRMQVERS